MALGCTKPAPDKAHTRYMFDAAGLQVITSFANRKQQTMSVLYGNASARQGATSGDTIPVPGSVFKLVVYKQKDNKFWYGSYINGALQRIETVVCTQAGGPLKYTLEQGLPPLDNTGRRINTAVRIAYILSHKTSVFP